ncbi:MAG: penicillin-binding protein [Anaerolineaceae bacterium]
MNRLDISLLVKRRRSLRQKASLARALFFSNLARVVLAFTAILISAGLIIGGFYFASLTNDLPSIDQLPILLNDQTGELLQPTRLLDRTGNVFLASIENEGASRRFLSVNPDQADHFSLQLLRLTVAQLDPTFWTNSGSTPLTDDSSQPRTIAERLVKTLLLAKESDSTRTTIRMKILASQVVHRYGRTQTLEWYLNSVYLGHLSYGAESAAQLYLHKSAVDLDLAESALLVSLMESPALNPVDAPKAALENQQNLLKALADSGIISSAENTAAAAEKLQFFDISPTKNPNNEAFIQLVIDQLAVEFGKDRVERGGLVVTTTLDETLQTQFECSARSQLIQIGSSSLSGVAADNSTCTAADLLPTQSFAWNGNGELSAGGLVMDPRTGQILTYVPPATLSGTVSSQPFEIGSLGTPFVALAVFARGTSPASLTWDVPASLPADVSEQLNPDAAFHGAVNVRSALANDYVVPFASFMQQVDPQTVWVLADATGLASPRQESATDSLLIGGGNSSLLEVAQAYSTLAAEGSRNGILNNITSRIDPVVVLNVKTVSGQVLSDHSVPQTQAAISRSLAYLINNVLSDQTARWPSLGHPNVLDIGRTAAVKTGAVASKDQVWTVGYTPDRLVLTWIGESQEDAIFSPLDVRMAAGLWHAMIQYSTQGFADVSWSQPVDVSSIQVCAPSGMLPTAICPNITSDVFLMGNEPTQADNLYVKLSVNRETNLLATVFTPAELIEDRVYLNVPTSLRAWAASAGLPIPPQGYDAISAAQTNPQVQITSPSLFAPVSGKVNISGTAATDNFASYSIQIGQGINPQTWQQVGATVKFPVEGGNLAVWNTTGLDGLYAIRLNVVDQNNQIQTAVIQVTVDNVPPAIRVTYPLDKSQILPINNVVTLNAEVTDQVGVSIVEWWMDGKKIGERTQSPFTFLWTPTKGKHTLQIKASDSADNQSQSESINFEIIP